MRQGYPIGDREVKFSETDSVTLPYALALIDWYLDTPDLEFKAIIWPGDAFDPAYFRQNTRGLAPRELAYNFLYKEVLRCNIPAKHRVLVTIDQRTRTKGNNLLEYLKTFVPGVRDVVDGDSKQDDLLQLVDLLTGCIAGGLSNVTHSRKRALVERLQRGAGMRSASDRFPTKVTREKLNLWFYQPRKTSPRQP